MSEEQSQTPENAIDAVVDETAPPTPEPKADRSQPESKASRPPGVPEKFWDSEAGSVRTEALLKSYLELERKLGSMIAIPSDANDDEGHNRLRRALGVPETVDGYQLEQPHELLAPSPEINAKLHEAGFTPQQAQLVYNLAAEHLLPLIEDALGELDGVRDTERLANRFGGVDAWRALANQMKAWGKANLSDEVFNTLSASYEGVLAMHQMMQAREPSVLRDGDGLSPELDETALGEMMRDPRYWRDRDAGLVAKVTEGFRRLYPS